MLVKIEGFFFLVKYEVVFCDLQIFLIEVDILFIFLDKKIMFDVMIVIKIFSDCGIKSLGDFEVQYIFDLDVK